MEVKAAEVTGTALVAGPIEYDHRAFETLERSRTARQSLAAANLPGSAAVAAAASSIVIYCKVKTHLAVADSLYTSLRRDVCISAR